VSTGIKSIVRSVLAAAALIAAAPAGPSAQAPTQAPKFSGPSSQSLHQLWNDYWEWRLVEEPELATSVGRPHVNDRWRDLSKAARDRQRATRQEFLERSLILSPGTLTPADYLSAILWEYELRDGIEAQDYLDLIQTVSQMDGAHNRVFRTIEQMPAATLRDYENILARLAGLPHHIDQVMALLDEQLDAGLARPAIVVDLMLEQMAAQRSAPAPDSPLLRAFTHFPQDMAGSTQRRLRAQAVAAYTQQFVPTWTRFEQYLRDRYRPRAARTIGLSSLPNGPAIYARLVRFFTSTKMTPDEIHDLGLKEVARIEGEMRAIATEYGFTGTLSEFAQDLARRPGMRFESEDEMLAYANDVLGSVRPRLPALFLQQPRTDVRIRPIPPDRAASTPSSYMAGTADGSRPAYFNMNTYRPTEQVKYTIEALVLHETVPGHHLQVGLARELENLPTFRTAFRSAAFSEGWGLYAESLGTALGGVYRDAPTRFGRLASEQFRAVRLVIDTGIHAKGWTREQAQAYFREHVPSQSLAEVDRYIAMPGQALAYKIGELRIQALRRRAEQALGTRFDVRAFHDVILRNGSLPLEMLDEQVSAYIAQAGK
jgi:uncharacterized protein (DUF885 family)